MPWFDLFIIAVLVLSTVISIIRGFAKDAISLAAWILAFIVALSLADKLALILPASLEDPRLRLGVAVATLFIATLVMGMVANFLMTGFINMARMRNLDRSLGAIFGFVRGVVIICLLAVLAAFIDLDEAEWWQRSKLMPAAVAVVHYIEPMLPDNFTRFIKL